MFFRFLRKAEVEIGQPRSSLPLQTFRVGLLKLLGNIDGKSSYIDLVGTYMVKKLAGTVEQTFQMIDVDGNGVLDKGEIEKVLANLGVHQGVLKKDVKTLMETADLDNDGVVSLPEFKYWYLAQKLRLKTRIEKLFDDYDQEKCGFITKSEFTALLTHVNGSTPPDEILSTIPNNDNITLANTIEWFESQNPIKRESIFRKRRSSLSSSILPTNYGIDGENLVIQKSLLVSCPDKISRIDV